MLFIGRFFLENWDPLAENHPPAEGLWEAIQLHCPLWEFMQLESNLSDYPAIRNLALL